MSAILRTDRETATLESFGVIHSPYHKKKDAPFQGRHEMKECTIEVFEDYEPGLLDIERCTHLFLLHWQDRGERGILQTKALRGPETHGVFSIRSSNRPNPIGLCVVDFLE